MTLESIKTATRLAENAAFAVQAMQAAEWTKQEDHSVQHWMAVLMRVMAMPQDKREVVIVWDGETPVGFGALVVAESFCGDVQLWTLAVYSAPGHGSAMPQILQHGVEWGRAHGFGKLFSRSRKPTPARRVLFEKHWGFTENAVEFVKDITI